MPGTYAHIAIANHVPHAIEAQGASDEAISAVSKNLKYCELGAVSPDYPYLVLGDSGAREWADRMHKGKTGALLDAGVECLRSLKGDAQRRALAWFLGYASHVTADMTVHPIVELKVGPYKGNEKAHRICEMNQDVYIFASKMNLHVGLAERFKQGIGACGSDGKLDPAIAEVWRGMLAKVYPDEYRGNQPDLDRWHRFSSLLIDGIAEEGDRLIPFARHVAVDQGLMYPSDAEVDRKSFIDRLETPVGPLSYDEVFKRAVGNVASQGRLLANAVLDSSAEPQYLADAGEWDLDTGRIDGGPRVFWEEGVVA